MSVVLNEGDSGSIVRLQGNCSKLGKGGADGEVDALQGVHKLYGAWSIAMVEQGFKPLDTLLRLPFLETSNFILREVIE